MDKTTSFTLPEGLDDWLRIEAAKRDISKGALVVNFCEMGRKVVNAGHTSLETYCVGREQDATADYLGCPEVEHE